MRPAPVVNFDLWESYKRRQIAEHLGYRSEAAIWSGVATPKNTKQIWLFVTRVKQRSLTQYNDSIYGNVLHWEGQQRHRTDKRIANARKNDDEIHLFFRAKHHQDFIYFGQIHLLSYKPRLEAPSQFSFEIEALSFEVETLPPYLNQADATTSLTDTSPNPEMTDRITLHTERIGHSKWRQQLLRLWDQSCSVTELQKEKLLRASHIKPWQHCSNRDRLHQHNGLILNPSLDCLFDRGFITFRYKGGHIAISNTLSDQDRKILYVHREMSLRKTYPGHKEYLEYHNDCVFEKWMKARMTAEELQRICTP